KAFESGRPGLDGPPWTGPTVIAPSTPVPASACVSAGAKPENRTRNTRIIGNFLGWSALVNCMKSSFCRLLRKGFEVGTRAYNKVLGHDHLLINSLKTAFVSGTPA